MSTHHRDTIDQVDVYPSRQFAHAKVMERFDPVVYGDRHGPLDGPALDAYEQDGFILVPGLLEPREVDELNAELDRLAADPAVRATEQAIVEPDEDELRSLFAIHDVPGPLARLARDPRLVGVARQLLGGDVYIHQSRANLKPGFRGREFYWHSDFETWHTEDGMPRMRAVSCAINLAPNHPWNGPLLVIAGSHRLFVACAGETPEDHYRQSLRRQRYGVPDDESLTELYRQGRIEQAIGPPGTALFFECNTMHGSNTNITPAPRRNVFIVYNSVHNTLEEPFAAPARRPEFIAARVFDPV